MTLQLRFLWVSGKKPEPEQGQRLLLVEQLLEVRSVFFSSLAVSASPSPLSPQEGVCLPALVYANSCPLPSSPSSRIFRNNPVPGIFLPGGQELSKQKQGPRMQLELGMLKARWSFTCNLFYWCNLSLSLSLLLHVLYLERFIFLL